MCIKLEMLKMKGKRMSGMNNIVAILLDGFCICFIINAYGNKVVCCANIL